MANNSLKGLENSITSTTTSVYTGSTLTLGNLKTAYDSIVGSSFNYQYVPNFALGTSSYNSSYIQLKRSIIQLILGIKPFVSVDQSCIQQQTQLQQVFHGNALEYRQGLIRKYKR